MRFSSRFYVLPAFSRIYITILTPDHESIFIPATVVGRDVSQSGKVRELVAFEYQGNQFMALVYPHLPMVAFYHGGEGKRYQRCDCWGQYPKNSEMRILTEICYRSIPR